MSDPRHQRHQRHQCHQHHQNVSESVPENETLSVLLSSDLRDRLDALAASSNRPRTELVTEAIDHYLAYQAWKLDRVREGIEAADRGDLHAHDQLFAELQDRYSASTAEKKPG